MTMRTRHYRITQLRFAVVVLLGAGLLASAASAQDIKITDYDVPISRWQQLMLDGSFSYADPAQYEEPANIFNDPLLGIEDATRSDLVVHGIWERFYNSLPRAWSVKFMADWSGRKSGDAGMKFSEGAQFSGSYREYPVQDGLLFTGGSIYSSWNHGTRRPNTDVELQLGLGRYIEAAALAKALRIDEFLIDEGVLTEHLPKATLLELASIIDRAKEYAAQYGETYARWWYADMEKSVASAATFPSGGVGPIGLLRMQEVVEREHVRRRAYGWNVAAGLYIPVSREWTSDAGDPLPSLTANFAWPLGLRHQLIGELRANTEVKNRFAKNYRITAAISHAFEMSNRIDLLLTNFYDDRRQESSSPQSYWRMALHSNLTKLALVYYVENRVSLDMSGSASYQDRREEYRSRTSTKRSARWRWDWVIDMRIRYHVL